MFRLALLLPFGAALPACLLHRVPDYREPAVEVPSVFAEAAGSSTPAPLALERWWEVFADAELNRLVEETLAGNLDLRQAWRRLEQAGAVQRISRSEFFPQVEGKAGASKTETTERDVIDPASLTPGPTGVVKPRTTKLETETDRYVVSAGLGWELDLWRRISSANRADRLEADATRQDAEEIALFLTGSVTETWFQILELEQLISLIDQQVRVGETLRELTELRFATGSGSALDVLQQRQQLAATRAELPPIRSQLATLRHSLALLLGRAPLRDDFAVPAPAFPALPPLPSVETPAALLARRPDLRAARLRVQAADYDVASAIADRLPRISFSLNYELSAESLRDIYNREVASVAGNLLLPIVDGGRRRAEVDRRKAVTRERLDRFGALFLEALVEVEDALVQERFQLDLLEQIDRQVELARTSLGEAQQRYINGLNDYLTVITAISVLQNLERRQIAERRALFVIRTRLYRALGGSWTASLPPPSPESPGTPVVLEH